MMHLPREELEWPIQYNVSSRCWRRYDRDLMQEERALYSAFSTSKDCIHDVGKKKSFFFSTIIISRPKRRMNGANEVTMASSSLGGIKLLLLSYGVITFFGQQHFFFFFGAFSLSDKK